ncbi:ATP-binding protein [Geotalea sp. SG265]|uniref:PAS domain-containing sensor histidine kinase n=1 Tax=Geotalea sp. SG265 TaxID=2922867 RepID=UPI001FAFB4D3|nr:ATP-binding protein [Geotalea sp. SG265]
MTSASKKYGAKIFILLIGLMLAGLIAEALLPAAVFSPLLHLSVVGLLAVLLVALKIAGGATKNRRESEHSLELQEMQREVDKTIRRYKSLLEGAGNAIFVFNADSGILEEVNRKGCELLGFNKSEMAAMRGKDLVLETEQEKFTSLVYRVKRRGRSHAEGITFERSDGTSFLGEIDARLINLGDKNVVHVIVRDVTYRHRARLEIQQRNRELSILNNILASSQSSDLQTVLETTIKETLEIFAADAGTIHLLEDDGQSQLLAAAINISPELQEQLTLNRLQCPSDCYMASIQHCHVLNEREEVPCLIARAAVEAGWQCITAAPLMAKTDLIGIMHIMTHRDQRYTDEELRFLTTMGNQTGIVIEQSRLFSELNWKNEELLRSHRLLEKSSNKLAVSQNRLKKNLTLVERANAELERFDRMKSHFIGMISHEFKTPLTSVLGGAEYLLNLDNRNLSAEQHRMLEMIYNGGHRLNEIVSDLLTVIKLETSASPVKKVSLQLGEIIEALQEQLKPLLGERKQTLTFRNCDSLPYFNGDREYLEEVFNELVVNAVKFTPDGGEIVIAGRVVDRQTLAEKAELLIRFNPGFYEHLTGSCYLEVQVQDSGIGIIADEQLKIFDKFYEVGDIRHHSSGKHKFQGKGTGLGLAIVKGMVEAHGGMVWVESSAGSGSTFFLLLPLEEIPGQPTLPFVQQESLPFEGL